MPQVEGHPNLFMNDQGVIINRDVSALARAKARRARREAEQNEISELRIEMAEMRKMISALSKNQKTTGK